MKSFFIYVFGLGLFLAVSAQGLRERFDFSDAVVSAEVLRSWDGDQGYHWRADTPNDRTALPIRLVSMRVSNWFKGSGASTIVVALPKGLTTEGTAPHGARFNLDPGAKALWFLQSGSGGDFRDNMHPSINCSAKKLPPAPYCKHDMSRSEEAYST